MRKSAAVYAAFAIGALICAWSANASTAEQTPGAPGAEAFKQAMERRLLKLIPDGKTEREVFFENVTIGKPRGDAFPFRATLSIRDYGAGYPKNHYYGETCVGRLVDEDYVLTADDFGGYAAEGRMTPDLKDKVCKPNLSEGVSSIPLSSMTGTRAGTAPVAPPSSKAPAAAPTASASPSSVALGAYECWANGSARGLMNFTVKGAGQYAGTDNVPGTFSLAANSRITFKGGSLDGVMPSGFYAVYHLSQGRPTVSFMGPTGSEAVLCQKK